MKHPQLVTPNELELFAERLTAAEVIPEIVNLLVRLSATDLTECRIPYGDSVGIPGWDGRVTTELGFEPYLPKGASLWEIGRGADPQTKATGDYTKRMSSTPLAERASNNFVFVTPRTKAWDEASQTKWLANRSNDGWQTLKILDGIRLCDWIREFPAVGKWLRSQMGLVAGISGFRTAAEHWANLEMLRGPSDPPLPPQIFVDGRDDACRELAKLFRHELRELVISIESEGDAEDFIAAFLQSLDEDSRKLFSGRCLFIDTEDAWNSFCEMSQPHVLVGSTRLDVADSNDLHLAARRGMHEIVITVSGAWTRGTESGVKIISPPRGRLETIFHEAQFPSERASELAGQGAHSLATLKRYMRGLGTLPPYANWPNARAMAQASILGKWKNDNEADRAAIEQFLGKSYGEWMETIRNESLRADAPLIQRNELWKVIGRGEAWSALGPRLSNEDLDRVTELAIAVLGGIDPEFSLEKEERYAAALSGQRRAHSKSLREGLTETLALLGTKGRSLVSTTQGKAEATAYIVVRKLLEDAPWERWAGMNDELPALAEASPDSFLNAVESVLNVPGDCPFLRVFQQEGAGFGGRTYISGLLWALETLAWDPKYIGRATLALGELAAMDPGGNFGNRPAGSLTDIYLPWHVQTLADLQQSKSALEALIRDQPIVGWKLLLSLLPSHHGSTTGTRKPIWRRIVPDGWTVNTSRVAYGERVQLYAALCIDLASQDVAKLIELTGRIENLPEPAHSQLLNYLSEPRNSLDEEERLSLWTILTELVRKHQRYAGANWAAPPDIVQKWISAADRLRPPSDAMTSRQLFSNSDYNLYEDDESLEAAHIRLVGMRQAIALRIFGSRGIDGLLEFAGQLEVPAKLGEAFGLIENVKADPLVLPALLMAPDKPIRAFAGAYVWARWVKGGIAWLDQQLASKWTDEENLQLLLRLPSLPDIWFRAEATLPDRGQEYWRRVGVNPYPLEIADLPLVAEKLLKNGQASSAVDCLFVLAHKKGTVSGDLAYRTFVSAFSDPGQTPPFNTHHIEQIIEALQRTEPLDSEVLFRVEWLCLPFLNRLHNNRPRALEHRLASSPSFFVEVVSAIFRRHGEGDEVESAPTEAEKNLASSAFSLLNGWSQTPGQLPNGEFDGAKFEAWLDEVKALSRQAGRFGGAMNQIGHMLALAKERAEGELWIHPTIAAALDAKDAKEMRDGFTVGLFNRRGVHGFTQGKEELAIAKSYRDKAAALRLGSFHRIAGAVDQLASSYEKDGESQRGRDFLDDL